MDEVYRGYKIQVTRAGLWHAVLIEPLTGTVLPTKATALLREGRTVAIARARDLVDIYAGAIEACDERAA